MASASRSDDVRARKLASIRDSLAAHNYEQAIRLSEMRDVNQLPTVKALRAVALERYGHRDAAVELAVELAAGKPTDPAIVAPLCTVLRNVGEISALVATAEHAHSSKPEDELCGRLFCFALLQVHDYKRLQAIAMRLFKSTSKAEYAMWAAVAIHIGIGPRPAPLPGHDVVWALGGGRGLSVWTVDTPVHMGALRIADTLLRRALDALPAASRDSEQLGLLVHTLVRQGKVADAYNDVVVGKYAFVNDGSHHEPAAPTVIDDGPIAIPMFERAMDEDVKEPADGLRGRGKSPGAFEPVDALRYKAHLQLAQGAWEPAMHTLNDLTQLIDCEEWSYHTAYAYAWAQSMLALLDRSDAGTSVAALLPPFAPHTSIAALGDATTYPGMFVAQLLRQHAGALESAAQLPVDEDVRPIAASLRRGAALAVLQHAAIKVEIMHRLCSLAASDGDAADAVAARCYAEPFQAQLELLRAQLMLFLTGYVRAMASKACCFGDVRVYLARLTQPAAAEVPLSTWAHVAAFLATAPTLIATPFSPAGQVGASSDVSAPSAAFTFSFTIPSPAAAAFTSMLCNIVAHARPISIADVLDAARQAQLDDEAAAASACTAAGTASVAAAASGSSKRRAKKGRGKARAAAAAARDADEDDDDDADAAAPPRGDADPHGVAAALKPAADIKLDAGSDAQLQAARACVRTYITAAQMTRFCGVSAMGDTCSAVNALMTWWLSTLSLADATVGGQREVQEGDDLLLLAVHVLWDAAFALLPSAQADVDANTLFSARRLLLESACILECGTAVSPYNMQLRLAAVRVYSWLGATASILPHHAALRIRYIMLDTMSYTLVTPIVRNTWLRVLQAQLHDIHRMHTVCARDTPEYVKVALRSGNYSQALDISRLHERLVTSSTLAACRSVYAHLGFSVSCTSVRAAMEHLTRIIVTGDAPELTVDVSPAGMAALRFNDDHDVYNDWSQPGTCAWQGNSETAPANRLTRLRARVTTIQVRHAIQSALLHALEGRGERLTEAIARVNELLQDSVAGRDTSEAFTGALHVLDTGATTMRSALRIACTRALLASLRAADVTCTVPPAAAARGGAADTSHMDALASTLQLHVSECGTRLYQAWDAIRSDTMHPRDGGGHVFNPRVLPELTLLVTHVLPYICLAVAAVLRSAPKPKAGVTSPLRSFAEAWVQDLTTMLTDINTMLQAVWKQLDAPLERARPLLYGSGAHTLPSPLCDWLATLVTSALDKSLDDAQMKAAAALPLAKQYAARAECARAAEMRSCARQLAQGVLASYKTSVESQQGEIEVRLAFLKTLV